MPSSFEVAFFNVALVLPPTAVVVGFLMLLLPRRKAARSADVYRHAA
jgi:hypothetical protein